MEDLLAFFTGMVIDEYFDQFSSQEQWCRSSGLLINTEKTKQLILDVVMNPSHHLLFVTNL